MALSFKSPPRVTVDVVAAAAKALGVAFPADYSAFLLETNGGVPKPRVLMADAGEYKVERLYSLSAKPPKAAAVATELVPANQHFRSELELPDEYVALGLVDDEDILLLTVKGKKPGAVSVWSMIESGFDDDRVEKVASSFGDFLKQLEQPSEKAKQRQALRKEYSKLETACLSRKWAEVKKLAAQLDLSQWVPDGTHPVFYAIECQNLESIKQLHAAGIPFDIQNHMEESPLTAATDQVTAEQGIIDLMVKRGLPGPHDEAEARVAAARSIVRFLEERGIA